MTDKSWEDMTDGEYASHLVNIWTGVEATVSSKNSAIIGIGWGDSHDWTVPDDLQIWIPSCFGEKHLIHPIGGPTIYRCARCRIIFHHHYHDIPNIFKAMKASDVPRQCGRVTDKVYSRLIMPRDDK